MEQLPGSDVVFLAIETDTVYAHMGGLAIVDPSDAPRFRYERLIEIATERLRQVPRFTMKLRRFPLDLDRPYLLHDTDFDVKKHVHRVAAASPGGVRELADVVGPLYSRRLDRRRSLWEMWFIEGLAGGRVAILLKTHHAIMDGTAGAGLAALFFDVEPNPLPGVAPRPPAPRAEGEPGALLLATRGLWSMIGTPFRLLRYAFQVSRQIRVMLPYLREPEMPSVTGVPRVSFNAPLGPERAFAWVSIPLSTVKHIKNQFGVKVNDVLLALTGSSVRRYLQARGELPEKSLVAAVPVSTRSEDDDSFGNQLTATSISFATDLQDPVARLLQIHKSATKAKEMEKAMRAQELSALGDTAPPGLINLAFRALAGAGLSPPMNVAVSNVAGPPTPLYIAGARVEHIYPMSLLLPKSGLNVTVFSHRDRVDFGFTVDPQLIPDPWSLADGIPRALAELGARIAAPRRAGRARSQRRDGHRCGAAGIATSLNARSSCGLPRSQPVAPPTTSPKKARARRSGC